MLTVLTLRQAPRKFDRFKGSEYDSALLPLPTYWGYWRALSIRGSQHETAQRFFCGRVANQIFALRQSMFTLAELAFTTDALVNKTLACLLHVPDAGDLYCILVSSALGNSQYFTAQGRGSDVTTTSSFSLPACRTRKPSLSKL